MSSKKLKTALVLAAGNGTRLWPLTQNRPKPYLPLAGKPIIGRIVEGLREAGFEDIYVVCKESEKDMLSYVESLNANPIIQKRPTGTASAVLSAEQVIDEPFLIASGDHVMDYSIYKDIVHSWDGNNMVATKFMTDVSRFGVLSLDCGKVSKAVEKPKDVNEGFVNLGLYVVLPEVFDDLISVGVSSRGEYEFTDVLEGFSSFVTIKPWMDVAYSWQLLDAFDMLYPPDYIHIEGDAEIDKSARFEGPVYVGSNVHIGKNVVIKNSVIEENSIIEDGTIIEDSYLMPNVRVGESSKLEMSFCGTGAIVGSNVRIEPSFVESLNLNGKHCSVRRELGSLIAWNKKVADDTTLEGGSLIY